MSIAVAGTDPVVITVGSTTTDGGTTTTSPQTNADDRSYRFSASIDGNVGSGAVIDGFGLSFETTGGGHTINVTNNGNVTVTDVIDVRAPALAIRSDGGDITYTGSGNITHLASLAPWTGLEIVNSGAGDITVNATGSVAGGMLPVFFTAPPIFGISARSLGPAGNVRITANTVTGDDGGITAAIANSNSAGDVIVDVLGPIHSLGGDGFFNGHGVQASTSSVNAASEVIHDFNFADGDRIRLAAIDANETVGGDQAFDFIGTAAFSAAGQIRFFTTGSETRILLNTDSDSSAEAMIRVSGVHTPVDGWFIK